MASSSSNDLSKKQKQKSSSNDSLLPFEMLESILRMVPSESVNRLKLTCKRWHALFRDKIFIYSHLDLVQEHFIRITDRVQIINPATGARSFVPLPDEFRGRLYSYDMIHCDGLFLCFFGKSLAVWNPCFNQVRVIIRTMWFYAFNNLFGIGYDNASRDNYKILRIYDDFFKRKIGEPGYDQSVEIYKFKSNSWRTLHISLDWNVYPPCFGVSMQGNMYWVGVVKQNQDFIIQSFDFSRETFKRMCLIPFLLDLHDVIILSVFRDDKLSLLHQHICEEQTQPREIEVWVTNKVKDNVLSWTKLFVVSRSDLPKLHVGVGPPHPMYFIDKKNRANIICCETLIINGREFVCVNLYIIGKNELQKKEIEQSRAAVNVTDKCGYVYLPSVVPVP